MDGYLTETVFIAIALKELGLLKTKHFLLTLIREKPQEVDLPYPT